MVRASTTPYPTTFFASCAGPARPVGPLFFWVGSGCSFRVFPVPRGCTLVIPDIFFAGIPGGSCEYERCRSSGTGSSSLIRPEQRRGTRNLQHDCRSDHLPHCLLGLSPAIDVRGCTPGCVSAARWAFAWTADLAAAGRRWWRVQQWAATTRPASQRSSTSSLSCFVLCVFRDVDRTAYPTRCTRRNRPASASQRRLRRWHVGKREPRERLAR